MTLPKDEVQATRYVCLEEDLKNFIEHAPQVIKALRDIAHAQQYEIKKHRDALSDCYVYFTAIDRTIENLNQRVQMLELRMAKESDGGHA